MAKKFDIEQLKTFSPLNGLKKENLHALLKKIKVERVARGGKLFKEGDTEKCTVYVLSGTIELQEDGDVVRSITGGTDAARHPVAPILPRRQTAVATDVVEFMEENVVIARTVDGCSGSRAQRSFLRSKRLWSLTRNRIEVSSWHLM